MKNLARLRRNIGANTLTTAIISLFQLLSVPVFINSWGVPLYGEWLALQAVTAYFQMTDVGLNSATANELTFAYKKQQFYRCSILITNNIAFVVFAFLCLGLLLMTLTSLGVFVRVFRPRVIGPDVLNLCLLLLFAQVFLGTLTNLLTGVYRATNSFARAVMVDNVIRVTEYAVVLAAVYGRTSLPVLLLLVCAVKAFGLALKSWDARRLYAFGFRAQNLSWAELRRIALPATSFLLFPVSNSISLQAPLLVVNYLLGSTAVVLFSTTRTLANVGRSAIDILHRSVWPEISLAYGTGSVATMRWLHRSAVVFSTALAVAIAALLSLFGGALYRVWTAGASEFDPVLMNLLLIGLVANTVWTSSGLILQATNNHLGLSAAYFGASFVSLLLSALILSFWELRYLPLAVLLADFVMLVFAVKRALALTSDSLTAIRNHVFAA